MKKHLIRENIPLHSPEWHSYRLKYLNASEIGAILGLSEYSCSAKIFNEKLGVIQPFTEGNRFIHFGLRVENIIAEAWESYEPNGEVDSYVKNCKNGVIIRKCKNIGGYIRNPKYDWLSMSLDRVINSKMPKMNGEILKDETPLELKSIQSFYLNKWETVPPAYLAQIHVQMLLLEVDYSELALLDSTYKLHVYPVEFNKEFADQIIDVTHNLWYDRIVPAKALLLQLNNSQDESERSDLQHQINQLEPTDESGSKAYEDFLKLKYQDSYVKSSKEGSMDDWENAVNYVKMNEEKKKVEQQQQLYKNNLLHSMGEFEYLTFDENNEISNTANKNGVRAFRIKMK